MDDLSITPINDTPANRYLIDAAQRLCCGNMLATYKRHGFHWNEDQFKEKWQDNKNFAIRVNGEWVGFLSLKVLTDMLYLRDLQLLPDWQRRGIGSACLEWIISLARQPEISLQTADTHEMKIQKHLRALRLRVFSDSSALALYERHGFEQVSEQCTPTRAGGILALQHNPHSTVSTHAMADSTLHADSDVKAAVAQATLVSHSLSGIYAQQRHHSLQ